MYYFAAVDVVLQRISPLSISWETLLQNKALRFHVMKRLAMFADIAELIDDCASSTNSLASALLAELLKVNAFESGDEQFSFQLEGERRPFWGAYWRDGPGLRVLMGFRRDSRHFSASVHLNVEA